VTARKKSTQKSPDAGVRAKPRKKHAKLPEITPPRSERTRGWMVAGFDTSMSSLAGAAIGWDATLNKFKGPVFTITRWTKEDHYFDRLSQASKASDLVLDLQAAMGISLKVDEVFIAQEEPFPPHGKFMAGRASGALKQQAEISGAFLGGILRYGFREIWQVHNTTWRKMVADMLSEDGQDITIHHTKWKDPALCAIYNCRPADTGKFRAKQWATKWGMMQDAQKAALKPPYFTDEIPDWPDLIMATGGHKPRPEGSTAKAFQPDDRYDALAIMWALFLDLEMRKQLPGIT
jgi:hypothetical protein